MRPRTGTPVTLAASMVAVLLLPLMALPGGVGGMRPDWAAPGRACWSVKAGGATSQGRAGRPVLDVLTGTLLGQQALALVIISYLVERFRLRIRFFPPLQQAGVVMLLLFNDRIVQLWVVGLVGDRWPRWQWWTAPLLGMLLWPWVFLALDALRQRERRSRT